MKYSIRELRDYTGLSQSQFANQYGIPLSTLQKWEQGESSPAPYFVDLLAASIPATNKSFEKHKYEDKVYFYDKLSGMVGDQLGNWIKVENINDVIESNLGIYLDDLFSALYVAQKKFNDDCHYDRIEKLVWSKEK